jgi:hypothetical protein
MLYQIGIQPFIRKQILKLVKGRGGSVKVGDFIVDVDQGKHLLLT